MDHRVQIERLGSKPADSEVRSLVPARERLIVALDVPALHDAVRLVDALASSVTWFKVGSELFTAAGPQAVAAVRERGKRVFLDLKFHDIPRPVASAVDAAVRLGAEMINLHVAAGEDAPRRAPPALRPNQPLAPPPPPAAPSRSPKPHPRNTSPRLPPSG